MAISDLAPEKTHGGRVLVVDDDHAVRTLLLTILESADYEVWGAPTGVEALSIVAQWRPDVIILDLAVASTIGREFLERRSSVSDVGQVPVIVVTAAATQDLPSAEQLGIRAVVQKPYDLDVLRMLIRCCLHEKTDSVSDAPSRRLESPDRPDPVVASAALL
jgi:CheY-like chemotaxis protein